MCFKKNQSQVKVPWYLVFGGDHGMPPCAGVKNTICTRLLKSTLFSLQTLSQMLPDSHVQSFPGGKTLVDITQSRFFGQHVCPYKSN